MNIFPMLLLLSDVCVCEETILILPWTIIIFLFLFTAQVILKIIVKIMVIQLFQQFFFLVRLRKNVF